MAIPSTPTFRIRPPRSLVAVIEPTRPVWDLEPGIDVARIALNDLGQRVVNPRRQAIADHLLEWLNTEASK